LNFKFQKDFINVITIGGLIKEQLLHNVLIAFNGFENSYNNNYPIILHYNIEKGILLSVLRGAMKGKMY
jgi:hypothetical protein